MRGQHRRVARMLVAVGLVTAVGCKQTAAKDLKLRQGTANFLFTITASQAPPRAMDSIHYTIVVTDRKTRQPIQGGEGQIYAGHAQGPKTWDGLQYGPEVGTYHGVLRYTMGGAWNVNIRFRRDSQPNSRLENTDWMQDVLEEAPYVPTKKKQ
jgi:hypothetical protein